MGSTWERTIAISSLRQVDEYARSEVAMSVNLQPGESRGYWKQQDPDLWFRPADREVTPETQRPSKIAEYQWSTTMDLLPGVSRGYWKHHSPGKWFRQAKITSKIHNEKANFLLDTDAEVSIVDTAFARKNLAFEATSDTRSEEMEVKNPLVTVVERPEYETPRAILQRPKATLIQRLKVEASQDQDIPDCPPSDESPPDKSPSVMRPLDLASVASEESDLSSIADEDPISHAVTVEEAPEDRDRVTPDTWATNPLVEKTTDMEGRREEDSRGEIEDVSLDQLHPMAQDQGTSPSECVYHVYVEKKTDLDPSPIVEDQPCTSDLDLTWDSDQDYDECVYYHEGSDLYAEDVDDQMAVLPEVPVTTEDVKIEDIQLCGSDNQTPEEVERLRQKISLDRERKCPSAGSQRPIALKCRKLRIQFREKLVDLIKGLLSAKMINYSRSPWASPSW
ncbi:reverse transcriptase [Phytophthora megakarya]|uniref:Reverse transcriptase n=1 Tax=Phytophthora megakarya TaxID=4795 RepID=A0A225V8C2_9STRA|nr:reverse transcriptase [Phytophthora megakarya]